MTLHDLARKNDDLVDPFQGPNLCHYQRVKIRSKKSLETPILKIYRAVQMREGGRGEVENFC